MIHSLRTNERASRRSWSNYSACDTCNTSYSRIFQPGKRLLSCESSSVDTRQPVPEACSIMCLNTWSQREAKTWNTWWGRSALCWKRTPLRTTCPGCRLWLLDLCPASRCFCKLCRRQSTRECSLQWGLAPPIWWRVWPRNWPATPSTCDPCDCFGHWSRRTNNCSYSNGLSRTAPL